MKMLNKFELSDYIIIPIYMKETRTIEIDKVYIRFLQFLDIIFRLLPILYVFNVIC